MVTSWKYFFSLDTKVLQIVIVNQQRIQVFYHTISKNTQKCILKLFKLMAKFILFQISSDNPLELWEWLFSGEKYMKLSDFFERKICILTFLVQISGFISIIELWITLSLILILMKSLNMKMLYQAKHLSVFFGGIQNIEIAFPLLCPWSL